MWKSITIAFGGLAIGLSAAIADAAVIYHHDFTTGSSSSPLNGTAPTVNNSGIDVVWDAHANTKLNGASAANTSNWLPFTFDSDIYTLEANIRIPGSPSSTEWFAIGFSANHDGTEFPNTGFNNGNTKAYYWFQLQRNGGWSAHRGVSDRNPFNSGTTAIPSGDVPTNIKIVFDNRDAENRTIAMYLNGVQLDLDPASDSLTGKVKTVPVGVGWGKANPGDAAVIDTFTLSVVPEPAATSLLAIGTPALLARRRHCRA